MYNCFFFFLLCYCFVANFSFLFFIQILSPLSHPLSLSFSSPLSLPLSDIYSSSFFGIFLAFSIISFSLSHSRHLNSHDYSENLHSFVDGSFFVSPLILFRFCVYACVFVSVNGGNCSMAIPCFLVLSHQSSWSCGLEDLSTFSLLRSNGLG